MTSRRRPLGHRAWMLVACAVPTALIFWANAAYVWNHFVTGGYYHDSAWYSAIIYHAGFFQKNPGNTSTVPDYWGIHVSLLCSFTSLLSYLAPVPRVLWYALFQGAIYAPLGTLVALTAHRAHRTFLDALLVVAATVVFATNGQVVACIGYPHFEIFLAAGLCVMLVGLATGRVRLAWLGIAMAIVTREDGGFHAASFAGAAIASAWFGRPFPVSQKTLWAMAVAAFAASVACFAVQKAFFVGANLFRIEYLGDPAFHHVTAELVKKRLPLFFTEASFVAFPLLGTIAIAIVRRDARYLLGWAVELPWLLLNFFAHQELKATFTIYTGFPFIGSIFWVGVYARLSSKEPSRGWLASLSFVSALATAGLAVVAGTGHLVNVLTKSVRLETLSPVAGTYVHALEKRRPGVDVHQRACPLFVPLVEEGWLDHAVTREVAEEYLAELRDARPESLILGCTHYPLLAPLLARVMGPDVKLVDSGAEAARATAGLLASRGLLAPEAGEPQHRFYLSDEPRRRSFAAVAESFLGRELPHVTVVDQTDLPWFERPVRAAAPEETP